MHILLSCILTSALFGMQTVGAAEEKKEEKKNESKAPSQLELAKAWYQKIGVREIQHVTVAAMPGDNYTVTLESGNDYLVHRSSDSTYGGTHTVLNQDERKEGRGRIEMLKQPEAQQIFAYCRELESQKQVKTREVQRRKQQLAKKSQHARSEKQRRFCSIQ